MSNQGTIRLKVTNSAPAIEKLWNNRYKLEFFCDNNTPKEDWYFDNVGAMLPEYGILQDANFGSGVAEDWEAIPGSVYPDMRLVLAEYPYNVRAGKHYVKLTYETLTASWVEEKAEDADYELNGLKRVLRTFVALPATAYGKVVGTSTIDSDGTTLYLGSFKIVKTDAKWSLSEVWLEAGILNETDPAVGQDFLRQKSITWQGVQGSDPAGWTFAGKTTQNVGGFQTITAQYYNADDISGVETFTYNTTQQFTIPGTVGVNYFQIGEFSNLMLDVTPPIQTSCEGEVRVFYSTIGAVSYPVNFYQPRGGVAVTIYGLGDFKRPFASTSSYSNHVRVSSGGSSSSMVQGNDLYAGTSGGIQIRGNTNDPSGQLITVSAKAVPVFRLDGIQYFRHEQVEILVPYRQT
jgi:hypothetical protein